MIRSFRKPRVLLDVDGVLADFLTPALEIINGLTGKTYRVEDIHTWDIFDVVGRECEQDFFASCSRSGFASSLRPYDGAKEGVRLLQELADIYVVTSPLRSPTWTHEREAWLFDHFKIPPSKVVHTSAKYVCTGDALLDDCPYNVNKWAFSNPHGKGVLWDASWNRNDKVKHRATGWNAVLDLVGTR